MLRVCAWHVKEFGKVLYLGEKAPFNDSQVSHGICQECRFRIQSKAEIDVKREQADRAFEAFMSLLP